jgi:hypothetical protein
MNAGAETLGEAGAHGTVIAFELRKALSHRISQRHNFLHRA